jgi:hypothetical protein
MQVTLVQCSPRLMGVSLRKCKVFLSGINDSKRVTRTWKMTKELVVQDLTEPMRILIKCGMWRIQIDVYQSYTCAT